LALLAAVLLAAVVAALVAQSSESATTPYPPSQIGNFVAYVHGKPGTANPKLAPVKIGWVNNQGGTIAPVGPESTAAAEFAVKWVNKYANGIDGHPLQLETCFVKNAEEEGLACAQQFLNDPDVSVISYGGVSVGADTINSTVHGKKPIIEGFSQSPGDVTSPGVYILFAAGNLSPYAWGSFSKRVLHAKTMAVLYPQIAGIDILAKGAKEGAEAEGIKVKLVGFSPTSTDLLGAFTAAGAGTADTVSMNAVSPDQCVAANRALVQLNVDPSKVTALFPCAAAALKKSYPGGDLPKWWYAQGQSGDSLLNTPAGIAYRKALSQFGLSRFRTDVWYSGMFGTILTLAQFMNKIGYDKITPQSMTAQVQHFKGPILLGEPRVQCGKYPAFPAACGEGIRFFLYKGSDTFEGSPWNTTPLVLQKKILKMKPAYPGAGRP
jgi:branched-chain amino acid transport system substrate-binding protein